MQRYGFCISANVNFVLITLLFLIVYSLYIVAVVIGCFVAYAVGWWYCQATCLIVAIFPVVAQIVQIVELAYPLLHRFKNLLYALGDLLIYVSVCLACREEFLRLGNHHQVA